MTHNKIRWRLAAGAGAVTVIAATLALTTPAQADVPDPALHYAADNWRLADWNPEPGEPELSTVDGNTRVTLIKPAGTVGTSFENTDLGLDLGDLEDCVLKIDYSLANASPDGSTAAGAVRLFAYAHADADTAIEAPDYGSAIAGPSTPGTLELSVGSQVGTVGVTYDASNLTAGESNKVVFENLRYQCGDTVKVVSFDNRIDVYAPWPPTVADGFWSCTGTTWHYTYAKLVLAPVTGLQYHLVTEDDASTVPAAEVPLSADLWVWFLADNGYRLSEADTPEPNDWLDKQPFVLFEADVPSDEHENGDGCVATPTTTTTTTTTQPDAEPSDGIEPSEGTEPSASVSLSTSYTSTIPVTTSSARTLPVTGPDNSSLGAVTAGGLAFVVGGAALIILARRNRQQRGRHAANN